MSCLNKLGVIFLRSCAWRSFLLLSPLLAKIPLDKAASLAQSANHFGGSGREVAAFILKLGSTLAALGGYHTLAGATQIIYNQSPSPAPTGANFIAVFQVGQTPTAPQSYKAEGQLPQGLRFYLDAELTIPVEGNIINAGRLFIKGQPYTPGDYPLTVTAYKGRNADGLGYDPVSTQITLKVVGDPIPQPQTPLVASFEQTVSSGSFSRIYWEASDLDSYVDVLHTRNLSGFQASVVAESGVGESEVPFPESLTMGTGDHFFWLRARRGDFLGDLVGPQLVHILPAPQSLSASQGDFADRVELEWTPIARADDYLVHVSGQADPFITAETSLAIPASAGSELSITVFGRSAGIMGIGTSVTGKTKDAPPPPRKFLSGFLSGDDGFQFNAMGFSYEGFYPFLYLFNYGSWLYVFNDPPNDTDGWFLYDFHYQGFGFTAAQFYPFYFGLSEGTPEAVDLSQPAP